MASDFIPPTVSQIRQVNVQLRANQLLPATQLLDLCKGTGVHEGTLQKVFQYPSLNMVVCGINNVTNIRKHACSSSRHTCRTF